MTPPWYPPASSSSPPPADHPEVKYEPRECRLRQLRVWAILTNASGEWTVANCLDKEPACERCRCALVSQDGVWPFDEGPIRGQRCTA